MFLVVLLTLLSGRPAVRIRSRSPIKSRGSRLFRAPFFLPENGCEWLRMWTSLCFQVFTLKNECFGGKNCHFSHIFPCFATTFSLGGRPNSRNWLRKPMFSRVSNCVFYLIRGCEWPNSFWIEPIQLSSYLFHSSFVTKWIVTFVGLHWVTEDHTTVVSVYSSCNQFCVECNSECMVMGYRNL